MKGDSMTTDREALQAARDALVALPSLRGDSVAKVHAALAKIDAALASAQPQDEQMISYTHCTGGERITQRAADPLPVWAYDVRPEPAALASEHAAKAKTLGEEYHDWMIHGIVPEGYASERPAQQPVAWRSMDSAPKDGTSVLLLIDGGEHQLQDENPSTSIGSYGVEGGPEEDPTWNFAGWSWHQDCYCRGTGDPIGWLPLPAQAAPPAAQQEPAPVVREIRTTEFDTQAAPAPEQEPLRKALQDLLDACYAADVAGNLAGEVDGSLLDAAAAALRSQAAPPVEPDIDAMVNRFLCWPLPKDFHPDAGISFDRMVNGKPREDQGPTWWPVGTNLFTAEQAKAMFLHALGVKP